MTKRTDEPSRFRKFCRTSSFYFAFFKAVVSIKFQRKIELRDPEQVLRQKFGNDLEVLNIATDKLVKFGDNYSSTIIKATIDVKKEGQTERLNLVAKMVPSSSFIRKFMQCEIIMAKEIFLYEEIIPAYQQIAGKDFDIAPKFYGGRLTMLPGEASIDESAVLLLENLKENGYVMEDRLEGLTLDHLKIAIPAIAKFHAIGFAMKKKNPEFFSKIKEHAKPFQLPSEFTDIFLSKLMNVVRNKAELSIYYERVKLLGNYDSNGNFLLFKDEDPENPYVCLIHRDLWINNTMFHKDNGKIDRFKFFDFQVYGFSSPMTDLIYFLFTSLPREFKDFDEAVKLYRESICDELTRLECDTSLFKEESFQKRLKEDAQIELYRCLAMANNIEVRSKWDMMRTPANTLQRLKRTLEIYDSKGWLDV